jgi:hypothetical protein
MEASMNQSIVSDYLQILDLVFDAAQSIKGKISIDYRMPDCQQLATKLYFHAATVYHLRQGTKAPVPIDIKDGSSFFDFASVAVLTRAIIDAYFTLFEVFFAPISDDEKEFRYQLWLLSGFVIREKYLPKDPSMQDRIERSKLDIQNMRNRISSTQYFKTLSTKQQKYVLKGKRIPRNWEKVAQSAGFGENSIKQMFSYYSGYTHSDGLSGTQIITADTRESQSDHIEYSMRIIMMIMSKMILNYCSLFPESQKACELKLSSYEKVIVWSEIAKRIP